MSVGINGCLSLPLSLSACPMWSSDEYGGRQRRTVNNNLSDIKGPDSGTGEAHRGPETKQTVATHFSTSCPTCFHAAEFLLPSALDPPALSPPQIIFSHPGLSSLIIPSYPWHTQEAETKEVIFLIVKNPTVHFAPPASVAFQSTF